MRGFSAIPGIPQPIRQMRLTEALERLVRLYDATGQKDTAAAWQKELEEGKAPQKVDLPNQK
jgi:hypothetical protein